MISNIREDGVPIGSLPDGEMMFHHDMIHREIPDKATLLYAVEIPSVGGDTGSRAVTLRTTLFRISGRDGSGASAPGTFTTTDPPKKVTKKGPPRLVKRPPYREDEPRDRKEMSLRQQADDCRRGWSRGNGK